ncbi:hypothetical protein G4D82_02530 [Flavobacterium sp. CYK-4]|uniref:fibronectin type III domain-containing protein n=1 Tax=Flavobacterium lotistagni TaxID=2709660 RepID=UPI00140DDA1B|nr:fibronectin type III domain-containing protein [Flavobacterium lotistagni]NHM06085.1 hypothetical protein [Flavobacterium lotistagni]
MKKIIFILLLSFSSVLGYSQILNEDFESAPDTPDGAGVWAMNSGNWLVKDNRTFTAPNWRNRVNPFPANSGAKAAYIDRQNLPGVENAEEWLITPQLNITANSQLRFFTRQTLTGDDNSARYQIRVSASADPSDLAAYTVFAEYTETELSTITADQLDYEEKTLDLNFTGLRYIAFVRTVTQPGLQISGDRWLVDDVKVVEKCLNPSVLAVVTATIQATTTELRWTAPNTTQFQVQYGPAGFTVDVPAPDVVTTPIFTSTTTPQRGYTATGLIPNTAYQYYVRGICPTSNSEWVGPFNWNTKPLGRTCAEPLVVTPLPYSDTSNTSIYGNNITGTTGAASCGASANGFMASNDVIYSYTAPEAQNIYISMNPNGTNNTGMFVYASCVTVGNNCIAGVGNTNSNVRVIPSLTLTAGQTIYIVLSGTSAVTSYQYNLNIQLATECPQPTGLTVTTPIGPTSAEATWAAGTETDWEVAVQTAGSSIPTTAGVPTPDPTLTFTTTLAGAALTPSTAYQYWVRANCGAGVYSPWSGPFLFNTSGCEVANQCTHTFTLTDTGGDGWNNGRMQVKQGGLVVATLGATITNGGPTVVTVPLCDDQPFTLFWSVGGDAPDEIRINIKNSFNQTIYAMTTNSQASIGTDLYTGTVDCTDPLCLPPTANPTVPAATITFNNAVVNWNATGTAPTTTAFELLVVTQGSPVPVNGAACTGGLCYTVPAPATTFTIPVGDLLPDTNYTVYIRAICSVNGPSDWKGGTNFRTKEQCPKPTALTVPAATITPFGATLQWTNAGQTNWQILVQLASLPDPLPDNPNWVTTNGGGGAGPTFSYVATGLIPETQYEFYIRTDCGTGIISLPAGPRAFTTGIACPKPTALGSTPTPFGGTFTWTNPGQTAWQVLVLPAGSPAPTADSTGWISVNPGEAGPGPTWSWVYNGTPLTPETNYVYYVRTNCGGANGVSTWAGPRAFTTTPTCFKPTTLTSVAAGLTAFSVTLQFTNVPSTTAWHVLALPQGSPAPNISTTGWVAITMADVTALPTPANNYTYVYTGLTPETAYTFYIRGNCGPGDVSTWSVPRNVTTPPSCYKPSALTATEITAFTAKLGWTNNVNSPVTEWQIVIVPPGSPAPPTSQQGTTVTSNPYTAPGLTPDTCYEYYVRSVCGGVNGNSTWAGPFNFCTIPTCPQPINPLSANNSDQTATLSWTEVGTATNWDLVYQTPGASVPNGSTVGIPLTVTTFTTPELEPGFYEFFVRSHCSDTDKSRWTGPITFFISVPPAICASVDISVETTSPGVIDLCPGENCVDLSAAYTDSKDTTTYTVLPLNFAPPFPFTGGTQLPVTTDDVWSAPFTLPFNFCFFGVNYPKVNVGSNGVITFDEYAQGANCAWNTDADQLIPDPTFPILNAIYGVYQDINPAVDTSPIQRSINYQVLGAAPCRAFVVNYYNVGQFDCGTSVGLQTSQIVLYETSNIIEVYVQDRTVCEDWNEGLGVIGIQNDSGTLAHFPPNRNLGAWEAHNEAWRFTPNGNSNVEFSWLKDGEFYSSNPTINVCVTETTNMTAKAVYTGCGGQVTTKTEDVLLNIQELVIPPIADAQACQSYQLPTLTVGNYFSQPGGVGPIDASLPITTPGANTIYVYASTTSTPPCTAEISFTVNIVEDLDAPDLAPARACSNLVLESLPSPFNYYTGPAGTGTMYSGAGGDTISSSQTLYVYGVSGLCSDESTFDITIDTVDLFVQPSLSDCNNVTLPGLPVNNTYYTAPGGPTGTGTVVTDFNITETQTIYIYAQSGECIREGNFTVNIFGIDPPTVNITQPDCQNTTGTVVVTSPVSPAGANASDLFISEVTDSDTSGSSLTYVELFNGTGVTKDLSNYKLKIYNNGNSFTSCEYTLSGTIANNTTQVFKVSNSPDEGGVSTYQQTTCAAGINENDNIRLTSLSDVEIDLWGATDGSAFTPNGETGYDYRRNTSATAPSMTWNPVDWTINDDDIYDSVGLHPLTSSNLYDYNIDGGAWQFTTTFSNVALGTHTITVREIATGCTNSVQVNIVPQFAQTPVTAFTYTTPVCNSDANINPDTSAAGFVTGGAYTSNPNTLVIDPNTGEINVAGSPAGDFTIRYEVQPDLANCISGGFTEFPITITAVRVPDFAEFPTYCPGATVPTLPNFSPNGIQGTWSPATIDNQAVGTQGYTFTPDANQCASVRTYNITIDNPTIVPTFNAIAAICAGDAVGSLQGISNNGISGTWLPATIDNTQTANYVFTPNPGQCALSETITVTVNSILAPDFDAALTLCSGAAAPALQTTSPNGISGTWSPSTIDVTQGADYVFTPTPNVGCYTSHTLEVTIADNPEFVIVPGCINGNYTLTITSDSNFETATFVWKDASGNVLGGNTSTLVVTQTGDYTVEVTYQGCSATQPINVTTISCTIQKGISPKGTGAGDGLNDYFDLEGQNVTKLEIFNRYGSKVYSKSNYSKEWYGQSDDGDELPDGTYFYVIERNGEKSKTGWIYINHEL